MCGIVGAMALGKLAERQEKLRQESMIFLTTELLQLTQARGTDATGTSILFNDGNFMGLKMGISSPEFISRFGGSKTDFEGFLKIWRENEHPVKTYLGHCRKTSVGSAINNANNHPIKVGNIVGVHNGTLTNHDVIFEKLKCKRDGDVDSEAIIRMLHFYTKKGSDPFTVEMLKEVCLRLQGTYSVIAYNADNPNQVATFRDGKPAVVALIRPLSLLLASSEESYIKQVLFRYNKHSKLYLSKIKFPILKKDDVDIKVMADDTCAVFNLENKVEKDTDVMDLFESEKIPRLSKIWKKGTTYNKNNNYNRNFNNNNVNKAADKTTKYEEKTTKDKENESAGNKHGTKGKVWNKDLKEFKNIYPAEEEKAKKIKSVEIDSDGKLKHIDSNEIEEPKTVQVEPETVQVTDEGIILNKVPKEKVNGLIGSLAKIHDNPVDYEEDTEVITVVNPSTGETGKTEKRPTGTTVEVNTNVNPVAMEAATKAASMQPKFENDDEVLEELEIDDSTKLEDLQLFALTNRISKVMFKKGYYKGFVRGQNITDKMDRAENNIKALKTIVKIFVKTLQNTSYNDGWKKDYIKKASEGEREITVDEIQRIFSAGDIRDNAELKYLKDECTKK